ncbi:hypothetical protein BGX28_004123 [Mortierella sp. GBA30]|nr:hypothetical protein BGX28_004123 [Mortierella sp. GBA30]
MVVKSGYDYWSLDKKVELILKIVNNLFDGFLTLTKIDDDNLEGTEDTLAGSKYLMTSGSGLSYLAAYLCLRCHVIYDMPKEWTYRGVSMTKENYNMTFLYMDEWVPYIRYLQE